jgi:lipopolysaccharide transport system ATP-binding protein
LLEVGTGFHPELTGRENVYLSGTFLGMRRSEIASQLEAIVDFSGIGKFADTPVKYYSSGMYVRLAFAVAAHLDPDILIVDEVLAVGDAAFQRKCLSKMEDVRQHGRTVLFVSHNMSAITRLCRRAILVGNGTIQQDGPAPQVTSAYLLSSLRTTAERTWPDAATAPGSDVVRMRAIRVRTKEGDTTAAADIRQPRVLPGAEIRDPERVWPLPLLGAGSRARMADAYLAHGTSGQHRVDTGELPCRGYVARFRLGVLPRACQEPLLLA